MKRTIQIVSALALAGTLLPALLFFADRIDLPQAKGTMLLAAILWFGSTPFWMDRPRPGSTQSDVNKLAASQVDK